MLTCKSLPRGSTRVAARRRLADLLAAEGTDQELARAEELYVSLMVTGALDHRLWEALARLHGARNDLLGLEVTFRRLRNGTLAIAECRTNHHLTGRGPQQPIPQFS